MSDPKPGTVGAQAAAGHGKDTGHPAGTHPHCAPCDSTRPKGGPGITTE